MVDSKISKIASGQPTIDRLVPRGSQSADGCPTGARNASRRARSRNTPRRDPVVPRSHHDALLVGASARVMPSPHPSPTVPPRLTRRLASRAPVTPHLLRPIANRTRACPMPCLLASHTNQPPRPLLASSAQTRPSGMRGGSRGSGRRVWGPAGTGDDGAADTGDEGVRRRSRGVFGAPIGGPSVD
ncbi:hypothetical protein GUJ93_ZPchr0006g41814 [Zizania palustris]|uniref:Uncharacterized protein n=1 Tax=Zizania palustris TaxID=103762 RepID=A0A8J5TDD8_ZIZPA|nr:hypothetical protein GUJ93_ZPchr0006g41814 [Zizania palustris]